MLTTFDNPFDPFEQFDDWARFDEAKGYYSCSRLARVTKISEDLIPKEIDEAIEAAIDAIVANDPINLYKKFTKEVAD
jgi:hypothetical protein